MAFVLCSVILQTAHAHHKGVVEPTIETCHEGLSLRSGRSKFGIPPSLNGYTGFPTQKAQPITYFLVTSPQLPRSCIWLLY